MMTQRALPIAVNGKRLFFSRITPTPVPPEKLYADLLKRQARRVMADVTKCPPITLPAHLARLADLREFFQFALSHHFDGTAEAVLSGAQLLYPATLADYAAALQITHKDFRTPVFINDRDAEIAEINRKLDTLAGLFSRSPVMDTLLDSEEMGVAA